MSNQELETLVATEVETAMARYVVNHDLAENIISVATKNIKKAIATHYKAREAGLAGWATGDDTGTSSNAIVRHMFGLNANRWGFMAPSDADDRGRCVRLLKRFPEWQLRLPEMNQYVGWSEQIPLILDELSKESPS